MIRRPPRGLRPRDRLGLQGSVEIFTTKGKPPTLIKGNIIQQGNGMPTVYDSCEIDFGDNPPIDKQTIRNIIVNLGKDKVITTLSTGFLDVVARMAIGDRGAIPSDPAVPKVPEVTATGLFNEVFRDDIDATVLDVGTPTVHEVLFIKTFSAVVIPITSFSNQASPVVNEVGLITADILGGTPLPRAAVAAPAVPEADEDLFPLRPFKSVPFEAANEISVTIRYTIFIE